MIGVAFSLAIVMFIPLGMWQIMMHAGQPNEKVPRPRDETYRAYECSEGGCMGVWVHVVCVSGVWVCG